MLVNFLVPGAANLQRLAPHLADLGVLNAFVYSHRLSTTPTSLGLTDELARNLWIKEYLTQAHLKAIGMRGANVFFPLYNRAWELGVLRNWRPAPVTHVLLWGAARQILRRVNAEQGIGLGLIANSHPDDVAMLLREEADRIGVRQIQKTGGITARLLEEVALCSHLHAESEFSRQSYIRHGFPADRIHVVRPGKDLNRFYPATEQERRRSESDSRFRVICVGGLSLRKGQVHLLEAWRMLHLKNAELTLVGAPNEEIAPAIRRYSGEFAYIPRVAELRPLLINASVMVVPSIEDGHGYVVGEALACGIPVITTVNTGAAEYITNGVNGYVVPIASPTAIAEHLLSLYKDRELRDHLRRGAEATIGKIGSWRDTAVALAELYRRLIGPH